MHIRHNRFWLLLCSVLVAELRYRTLYIIKGSVLSPDRSIFIAQLLGNAGISRPALHLRIIERPHMSTIFRVVLWMVARGGGDVFRHYQDGRS